MTGRSSKNGPFVIEMMGTPGAGKTTVAGVIAEILAERGAVAVRSPGHGRDLASRTAIGRLVSSTAPGRVGDAVLWRLFTMSRLRRGVWFAMTNGRLMRTLFQSQSGRPQVAATSERKPIRWLIKMAGERAMMIDRVRRDEIVIVDEGFSHRVVQLFTSQVERPNQAVVDGYIRMVPAPDLVLRVTAETRECRQRVVDRGVWGRFSDGRVDELDDFLANASWALDLVTGSMSARDVLVKEIANPNGLSPEALRAQIESVFASTAVSP